MIATASTFLRGPIAAGDFSARLHHIDENEKIGLRCTQSSHFPDHIEGPQSHKIKHRPLTALKKTSSSW
jgi:hypothetical protein